MPRNLHSPVHEITLLVNCIAGMGLKMPSKVFVDRSVRMSLCLTVSERYARMNLCPTVSSRYTGERQNESMS